MSSQAGLLRLEGTAWARLKAQSATMPVIEQAKASSSHRPDVIPMRPSAREWIGSRPVTR